MLENKRSDRGEISEREKQREGGECLDKRAQVYLIIYTCVRSYNKMKNSGTEEEEDNFGRK